MGQHILASERSLAELARFVDTILGPERRFYALAVIYGVGISLLSLATPISVQMLINTVAYTGLITPLVVLSVSLFVLLLIASLLNALRIHLMDLFSRRFYARMVSEVALRSIYAVNPFFEDNGNGTLFNRYFDIVVVLKSLPNLLVSGFTVLLQVIVGFILVSLYHPLFLAFNVVVLGAVWLVWAIWGKRAIRSAVELSHRKHATAAWLEGLGASNGFFKSERHIDDALQHTDEVTRRYIDQHRLHFRHHFSQTLWFLFIYASASALLLGLGGWLVIRGELSLGQLVAAELVLSVAFFGISQMGVYLTYFYDLCAAVDELSRFYEVEQERFVAEPPPETGDSRLELVQSRGDARGVPTVFNFTLPAGARVRAQAEGHAVQRVFTNFLKGHESPRGGYITLGGLDLQGIPPHTLRQQLIVLDRPNIIEMTIREFLRLSDHGADPGALFAALDAVGLQSTIAELDHGLDTRIASTGWPLSIAETMQLKLASAILARPRVLVLNQLYDVLPVDCLLRSFELLRRTTDGKATVIFFSNRDTDLQFDTWLKLSANRQVVFDTAEAFRHAVAPLSSATAVRMPTAPPARRSQPEE
jgi:putative ABC transport system ATP-binding protein